MSILVRLQIWLLNLGVLKVSPWDDPRRTEWERDMWRKAEPKPKRGA